MSRRRPHADHVKLLHGPYEPPALKKGDRAFCLFRDADVIVTSWTAARIPWPRCRLAEGPGGGSGLLVDEEFARALRCESALAIKYWWGASQTSVWAWRKALGVPRYNEGSARLRVELNAETAEALPGVKLPPEQVERRRRTARELGLRPDPSHVNGRPWMEEELALLGKLPDDEVARRTGRTWGAVRQRRNLLKIPTAKDYRYGHAWRRRR
jgi:hypothetical protein